MILSWWHKKTISHDIFADEIVLTSGASHAIAVLFKMLGQEGFQYLNQGDKVLVISPGYSSLNLMLEKRGLEPISISISPTTGEIEPRSLDQLKKVKGIKLILLVNPNNPSGFAMSEHTLKYLGHFSKEQDALIIADEIYSDFFDEQFSMVDLAPERTLRIQSCSKIDRSPGLRLGDILITKECNSYLTQHLFKGMLPEKRDFKSAFMAAKAPGGIHGEFLDTCFVPGPSQLLAFSHIVLEQDERIDYRNVLNENGQIFTKALNLPHEGNRYYILFDLNSIEGSTKNEISIEQKILELAKLGVILLPANSFFSKEDREAKDRSNMVRACLANGDSVKIQAAAKIIRDYITS